VLGHIPFRESPRPNSRGHFVDVYASHPLFTSGLLPKDVRDFLPEIDKRLSEVSPDYPGVVYDGPEPHA